jgi:hypothetical protein
VAVGALTDHIFVYYTIAVEPKSRCLGSAGVSPAAFGVPPNALVAGHRRLGEDHGIRWMIELSLFGLRLEAYE